MYFEIEDYRPDITPVGRAISWREGVLLSIIAHMALIIIILALPDLLPAGFAAKPVAAVAKAEPPMQFVFMQPRVDTPSPRPPDRGEFSDQNRVAQAPQRADRPTNPLPFSRGNSPERTQTVPRGVPRGQGPGPDPAEGEQAANHPQNPAPSAEDTTPALRLPPEFTAGYAGHSLAAGGALGDALSNLQRYVETQQFDNPNGGGGEPGASIQFDSKGVEFGPWLRRFIAQVRRNWFIPYAAMTSTGHVVVTFNVHKDGSITDLSVAGPSPVAAFNTAAVGALSGSNPTQPLPPEYPSDQAFFTVTFYYNEDPPAR